MPGAIFVASVANDLDEYDRDDDGEDSLDEDPLESDQDPDEAEDSEETVPCPFCRKPIHENADVCPRCGNYVGGKDASRRLPLLVWIGVALAGLCVLTWVLLG
jgi:hypothetical protein